VNDLEKEMSLRPVPEFTVPHEYIPILLDALKPAEVDNRPTHWEKVYENVGEITIQTKGRDKIRVKLYDTGQSVAGFTVDGVRCFRGGAHLPTLVCAAYETYQDESVLLTHIIREIHKEKETRQKSDRLADYIADSKRSRGEMPPERR
jgi:hypothetical protein